MKKLLIILITVFILSSLAYKEVESMKNEKKELELKNLISQVSFYSHLASIVPKDIKSTLFPSIKEKFPEMDSKTIIILLRGKK